MRPYWSPDQGNEMLISRVGMQPYLFSVPVKMLVKLVNEVNQR